MPTRVLFVGVIIKKVMTMRATHTQQKPTALSFIGTATTTLTPKQTDTSFNFDLDRMKKAVDAESYAVPNTLNNFDDFDAWLNQL